MKVITLEQLFEKQVGDNIGIEADGPLHTGEISKFHTHGDWAKWNNGDGDWSFMPIVYCTVDNVNWSLDAETMADFIIYEV